MKIISLSLDKALLDKDSIVAKKTIEYAFMIEKYLVIVPSEIDTKIELSEKLKIYGVGGNNRAVKLIKIYILANLLAKKYKTDLISSQDPFELGLIAYLIKKRNNIAWNTQEHGDFFSQKYWRNESLLNFFRYFLGRFLIKRADSIRVVSKRIRERLVNDFSINSNKIVVVPVLTDILELRITNYVMPVGRQELRDQDSFVFLSMGRFVAQKNLPLLLNAFIRVREKYSEARLRLIGKGKLEKKLKESIVKNNLSEVVELIPWTDDVNRQYRDADAYVLSSNYEGWGRVIVEAAANHLPIVMTDVGCAGEFIIGEESGLVVPVGDEKKLAEAMIRMIEDKDLRERLSKRAFENIGKLPDKEETLRLYKEGWEKAVS